MSGHFDDIDAAARRKRSTIHTGQGGTVHVTTDPVGVLLTVHQPSGQSYSVTLDIEPAEAVLIAGELERAALRVQRTPTAQVAEARRA